MQSGSMRSRVRLEQKLVTQDPDYGTQTSTWATFATVWAEVLEILPSRAEKQNQNIRIENRPATVRIRYLPGVNSDMRVIHIDRENREMRIVSGPAEMGHRRFMELMCESYSTNGNAP